MPNDLPLSNKKLAELHANRSNEDKLRESLIHMIFVGLNKHPYDPDTCDGCKEAKKLAGI